MNIYTVSFFGHREVDNIFEIEKRLENIIRDLIIQKEYVDFLVGKDGEFDQLVSSTVRRIKKECSYGISSLILVLPFMKAEYHENEHSYLDYYDEVEICSESFQAYFKSAIQIRNRCMVQRSNLVICCIQRQSGGTYQTIQYAEKQGRKIVNLAEQNLIGLLKIII